jgi:hypothetical protein
MVLVAKDEQVVCAEAKITQVSCSILFGDRTNDAAVMMPDQRNTILIGSQYAESETMIYCIG